MKPVKSALLGSIIATSAFAQQQPLSAIDWLDELVAVPVAQPAEPGVTDTAATPDVDVIPLDTASADAVGLLPASTTGLPVTLWSASATADLTDALNRIAPDPLPALQALYYTLLLAEADAPGDAGTQTRFLRARVRSLMSFGAVDAARALLERAGPQTPELFDQWLDLALLTGDEDEACKALRRMPALSPSYAARIYCTARTGNWPTAALIYETAVGLDALPETDAALLGLYLDPEMIEVIALPTPPREMSPLTFRLYEAAGSPFPTARLPRAFAMADLRNTSGWRTEIEAAERLVRTGALPANRLLGLYTDRKPAASGGVWERVRAVQALERALSDKAPDAIAKALPQTWKLMHERGLAIAFAQLFAGPLRKQDLHGDAQELSFAISLLSEDYEQAENLLDDPDRRQGFLIGVASGTPDIAAARTGHEQAIARGFATAAPARDHEHLIRAGKIGVAILVATNQLDRARRGNPRDLAGALSTLRSLGLEDTARRAALQILILGGS
ncbi:hypothetical protein AAFO92_09070 [Roseovarius sp. CAU 1744]|uniref:hypothetical protein n=1 Tax=Roseovarius sp. CAU 1744 TaxID=3140368 RepID=UPI00325B7429